MTTPPGSSATTPKLRTKRAPRCPSEHTPTCCATPAMHLYQAGMPLALLTEWLGHADPETTLIYAHADTEMKRQAIQKATANGAPTPHPAQAVWHDNEDILNRLLGLR